MTTTPVEAEGSAMTTTEQTSAETDWYSLSADDVVERLDTQTQSIDSDLLPRPRRLEGQRVGIRLRGPLDGLRIPAKPVLQQSAESFHAGRAKQRKELPLPDIHGDVIDRPDGTEPFLQVPDRNESVVLRHRAILILKQRRVHRD